MLLLLLYINMKENKYATVFFIIVITRSPPFPSDIFVLRIIQADRNLV